MPKRATLDIDQFKVELPPPQRDPLDSVIPTAPPKTDVHSGDLYVNPNRIEVENEQMNERSIVQKDEGVLQRLVIRHTFDIFQDQLVNLKRLQIEAMQQKRRKRKLGQMVQQALDQYIKRMKEKYSLQG